jgi:arabinofuranosyltransferase
MLNSKVLRNTLFALLVLGYVYYCYRYIIAASFSIEGTTYHVLFDDAMISMRYAYNLAHGLGPVWNAGERVEGFTNPLWVGIMAMVHLLPVELNQMGLYIQILGASLLILNLFLVRKIVEHFTDDLFVMLAAVALTAFYAPLNSFSLLGMEVSLLVLMVSAAVWLILRSGAKFNIWIYILMAVSTLVRFDMAVPYLVIFGVMFITQKENRRQHIIWGLSLFALFLGGQTLGRYLYYGVLLPNTYYLKVEGWNNTLRLMRGAYALTQFAYFHNWVLFLLPLSVYLFRRDWKINLLVLLFAGQIAYSVYVGGDAWEHHGGANRYILVAIQCYFVLFSYSSFNIINIFVESLFKRFGTIQYKDLLVVAQRSAFLFFFALSLLTFNALIGEWKSVERWSLDRKPDFVAGSEQYTRIAYYLEKVITPDARVAVTAAGNIAYFLPDNYVIDILGKADATVAHGPVRIPMGIPDIPNMQPGHMKWNYEYTFGELKPDVIAHIRVDTEEEAAPYLEEYIFITIGPGVKLYLRNESPNIKWEVIR